MVISLGFRLYLQFFNSYNATYGSLGAVIILMLWLYLTGTSILIGGEINSQIAQADEHRRAHDTQLQKLREELERDFKKAA